MSTHDILHRLSETLASRRHADPETSYTAKLFANGPDSILKKIGEETAELIMAGKEGNRLHIVRETAVGDIDLGDASRFWPSDEALAQWAAQCGAQAQLVYTEDSAG